MNYFLAVVLGLLSGSSFAENAAYYWAHPNTLQAALDACEKTENPAKTCKIPAAVAKQMGVFAVELRSSPQGFGQAIMALQTEIATLEAVEKTPSWNAAQAVVLAEKREVLSQRLAVVSWLESPNG